MNDFTKEELIELIDSFDWIEGETSWEWKHELRHKIELMIDNYCKHEPDTMGISCSPDNKVLYTVHKCSKCKRFYFDDNQ